MHVTTAGDGFRIDQFDSHGQHLQTDYVDAPDYLLVSNIDHYYKSGKQDYIHKDLVEQEQNSQYIYAPAGVYSIKIQPFRSVDRTNSRILRIIELPYAPFNTAILSDTNVPNGWIYDADFGTYRTLANTLEFGHTIKPQDISSYTYGAAPHIQSPTAEHDSRFESKLWTSSFFTYKFVYDSSS